MLCCCARRRQPVLVEKELDTEKDGTHALSLYLPDDVTPIHYDLVLQADLTTLQYRGVVDATVAVKRLTRRVTLHADSGLRLGAARVNDEPVRVYPDVTSMTVSLELAERLVPGTEARVQIAFAREIDASLMGFFRSGDAKYAFTQFSPIAARRAFPCWDEPSLKATFSVSIVHSVSLGALSNMPGTSKRVHANEIARALRIDTLPAPTPRFATSDWTLTEFKLTPPMSSYLVGWAVGPFAQHSGSYVSLSGRTVRLTLHVPAGLSGEAESVLDMQRRVLPVLEDMFHIAYPLPKLDTLTVRDFGPSAMENWGLIIGRADTFMAGPGTSLGAQMSGAGTMCHELAHMWFGNLVSVPFWDSVWLKEALATLVGEVIALSRVYPEWECATAAVFNHVQRALEVDARRASHAIEIPLTDATSESIGQVFDAVSYSKGASVLRMLAALVGEDKFLRGLRVYLERDMYGSASVQALWTAMSEASGVDVPAVMSNWVLRQGFPVVTATDLGDGCVNVSQSRFLATGDAAAAEDTTIWHIPLAIRTITPHGADVDSRTLASRETVIKPTGLWKLNADTIGFYRVAYPADHLARLGAAHDSLSDADRVGLIGDAFALAQAGHVSTSSALTLANLVKGTHNSTVISALASALGNIASVWWEAPADVRIAIHRFRTDVFAPEAQKLTLKYRHDEPHAVRALRTAVVGAAAAAGDALTLHELHRRFQVLIRGGAVHPDLLPAVLMHGVKRGGQTDYNFVRSLYTSGKMRVAALRALCSVRGAQLDQTAALLINGTIRATDYVTFFTALGENPAGRRLGWQLLSAHYDMLIRRGASNFVLPRMVAAAISTLTTADDEEAVRAFFAEHDTSAFSASLGQGLDAVRARRQWLERDTADLRTWLVQYGYL